MIGATPDGSCILLVFFLSLCTAALTHRSRHTHAHMHTCCIYCRARVSNNKLGGVCSPCQRHQRAAGWRPVGGHACRRSRRRESLGACARPRARAHLRRTSSAQRLAARAAALGSAGGEVGVGRDGSAAARVRCSRGPRRRLQRASARRPPASHRRGGRISAAAVAAAGGARRRATGPGGAMRRSRLGAPRRRRRAAPGSWTSARGGGARCWR